MVDRYGADREQDLPHAGLGHGHVLVPEDLARPMLVEHDRLHVLSFIRRSLLS
jgi:hypothetical protein